MEIPKQTQIVFYLFVGSKMRLNPVCPNVVTKHQHIVNSDLFNQSVSLNWPFSFQGPQLGEKSAQMSRYDEEEKIQGV